MIETPGTQDETLAQRLTRGPLDSETALDILRRVLKTLAFRHWSGAVHGSITPKTIVVAPDGQVTLTGFKPGAEDGDLPPAPVGRTGLDPRYMAPEQIAGVPADARADVFAMGIIAYEMLTGQYPFGPDKGLSGRQAMSNILSWPSPEIPPALLASLPAYVGPALDRALAKNPDDRFSNAETFLEALRDPEPQTEIVEAPAARRRKPAWLRYYALPLVMAIVVLVVVLLVLTHAGGSADVTGTSETPSTGPSTSLPATSVTESSTTMTTAPSTTMTTAPTSTTLPTSTTSPTAPVTGRYEETTTGLVYAGTWLAGSNASYSGGRFDFANASGASVTISFDGTYLAWIAKKSPAYGIAKVTLDGATTFTVDLYAATTLYQQNAWDTGILSSGPHTVKIEWTGTKNALATATNINLDAVDVSGTLR